MVERGLFEVSSHLLKLGLSLLVHLDLSSGGAAGLLQPLADLLQLPGEVGALLLHLGPGGALRLDLLLQLLNTSLLELIWTR